MLNQKFMGPAIAKRGFASSQEINWALMRVLHQNQSELSIFFYGCDTLATSQLFWNPESFRELLHVYRFF